MRENMPIEVIFSRRVVWDADPYELDCPEKSAPGGAGGGHS